MSDQTYTLTSPSGSPIVGTLEVLHGTALADRFYVGESGQLVPEYIGETEIHWNGQEGADFEGEPVVIDADGIAWLTRECERTEAGA